MSILFFSGGSPNCHPSNIKIVSLHAVKRGLRPNSIHIQMSPHFPHPPPPTHTHSRSKSPHALTPRIHRAHPRAHHAHHPPHHPHLHFRACKRTVPRSVVSPCCWLAPNASPCGTFVVCRRVGSRRRIHVGRYMSSDPRQSSSPATRNRLCATACCCSLHAEDCDFH